MKKISQKDKTTIAEKTTRDRLAQLGSKNLSFDQIISVLEKQGDKIDNKTML